MEPTPPDFPEPEPGRMWRNRILTVLSAGIGLAMVFVICNTLERLKAQIIDHAPSQELSERLERQRQRLLERRKRNKARQEKKAREEAARRADKSPSPDAP